LAFHPKAESVQDHSFDWVEPLKLFSKSISSVRKRWTPTVPVAFTVD
jgi:hypothetical protein